MHDPFLLPCKRPASTCCHRLPSTFWLMWRLGYSSVPAEDRPVHDQGLKGLRAEVQTAGRLQGAAGIGSPARSLGGACSWSCSSMWGPVPRGARCLVRDCCCPDEPSCTNYGQPGGVRLSAAKSLGKTFAARLNLAQKVSFICPE